MKFAKKSKSNQTLLVRSRTSVLALLRQDLDHRTSFSQANRTTSRVRFGPEYTSKLCSVFPGSSGGVGFRDVVQRVESMVVGGEWIRRIYLGFFEIKEMKIGCF